MVTGQTQYSRFELNLGSFMELRNSLLDGKRTAQVGNTHKAYSINVYKDGRWCCRSDEVSVMEMERRGLTILLDFR